jgi:FkbM family methyltransferase
VEVRAHAEVDRQVFNGIFARDEYRLNAIAPGAWDTVLDAGANIGIFSVRVAPLAKRVLSYEPMPQNFKYLQTNVGRFRHVVSVPRAISGKPGTLDLNVSDNTGGHSVVSESGTGKKIQVEAVTIAQIFAEHSIERCNLIKMDIEGAEYDSLTAIPAELWPRIDRIHMEYHQGPDGWNGEKLASFLRERGYRCDVVPRNRHPDKGNLFASRV